MDQKTIKLNETATDIAGGGHSRREVLKATASVLGSVYLAPATMMLLTAKRATAQSVQDVNSPVVTIDCPEDRLSLIESMRCTWTAHDETGLSGCLFDGEDVIATSMNGTCSGTSANGTIRIEGNDLRTLTVRMTGIDTSGNRGYDYHTFELFYP